MPGTKPSGPYRSWFKKESTPFTFEEWVDASDHITNLDVPSVGSGVRERRDINESRADPGRYRRVSGRYLDVPWSVSVPFIGSGTAGTAVAARGALYEAGGLSATNSPGTSETYETDSADPDTTISGYFVDRSQVIGEYIMGAIVQTIDFSFSKDGEPMFTFTGLAARKWEFGKTTLAAEIAAVDTLSMTLSDNASSLRTGSESTTDSGLCIFATIESETVKITAVNWATGVCTIVRAQHGTAAATHATALAVSPHRGTPTLEAGLMSGEMDWVVSDGSSFPCTTFEINCETGRRYDQLQSDDLASAGVNNGPIIVNGSFSGIYDQTRMLEARALDAHTAQDFAITLQSTAGSIFTINLDNCELTEVDRQKAYQDIEEASFTYESLDTATALRGALQIVET